MLIVLLVILIVISCLIFTEDYLGKYKLPIFVILGFLLDCLLKTRLPVAVVVTGSHFFLPKRRYVLVTLSISLP